MKLAAQIVGGFWGGKRRWKGKGFGHEPHTAEIRSVLRCCFYSLGGVELGATASACPTDRQQSMAPGGRPGDTGGVPAA